MEPTCSSLAAGTARLLHVGSIASLYLGPNAGPITGATPPDPEAVRRGDYARAKAECDLMLLAMHEQEGLPLVILRPGLVVGRGTSIAALASSMPSNMSSGGIAATTRCPSCWPTM